MRSLSSRSTVFLRRELSDLKISTVGVVGMGLMGHGIAQTAAMAGYTVIGVDANEAVLAAGRANIEKSMARMHGSAVKKGKMTAEEAEEKTVAALSRLSYACSTEAVENVDLVVEAIVEKAEVKAAFYGALGKRCQPSTIFASNTSSLKITPMAEASGRPGKFVGLHYFNPVQLMPLVEVIKTPLTDPEVFAACGDWVRSCGKQTVDCQDTPGFIVNRLLVPNIASAIAMVDRGHAGIAEIDLAMRLGAGQPMGPIALADYVGLDTMLSILEGWCADYPDEPAFFVPTSLKAKVAAGKLGRKSGEGYYVWADGLASTKPTAVSEP